MKKEVAHNLVIILVLVATIGLIIMNSNLDNFKFTGNVISVLEDYNESECRAENFTWKNVTQTNYFNFTDDINCECINNVCKNYSEIITGKQCGNVVEGLDCSTYDEETCIANSSCAWQDIIEKIYTNMSNCECIDDVCKNYTEVIKGQCEGDLCNINNLDYCDEAQCDNLEKYWYDANNDGNSTCNEDECSTDEHCNSGYACNGGTCECEPATCSDLGYECASVSDGCGNTLECGTCQEGYDCKSGKCEKEKEDEEIKTTTIISKNPVTCVPEWTCTEWSECLDGKQERICTDTKNCGSENGIPDISQSCVIKENCFDGIKNQDEKGIDCGGVCEKKCSVFTIVGGVINGPIESSKEFFLENKARTFIILAVFIVLVGGIIVLKVFWKQVEKKINFVEIKSRCNKLFNKFFHKSSDSNLKV